MKPPNKVTRAEPEQRPDSADCGRHAHDLSGPAAGSGPGIDRRASPSGPARADLAVVALLVLGGVVNSVMATRAPSQVGFIEDDGIYFSTARALADGRGYRHLSLPGEPYQTKYPILYPLALAALWRVFPTFPQNIVAAQVMNGVFACAACLLAYAVLRRGWRLSPALGGAALAVATTNPNWWSLVQSTMSEHLFGLLAAGALVCACLTGGEPEPGRASRPGLVRAALAGLLAAGAYLTRSIGLSAVLAVVLAPAIAGRRRPALLAALAAGIPGATWLVWRSAAQAANQAIPQAAALTYDLSYAAWMPDGIGEAAWVMYHNVPRMAYGLVSTLFVLPDAWLLGPAGVRPWAYVLMAAAAGLVGLGLAVTWARARCAGHLYLAGYAALVWVWPFDPERLLVPLLPFVAAALLAGISRVSRSRRATASRETRSVEWAPVALAAGMVLWNLHVGGNILRNQAAGREYAERQELIRLLRERTASDAVIAAESSGFLHLSTGRKVVPIVPAESSIRLLYAPDARLADAGRRVSPAGQQAHREALERGLLEYYERTGVTDVVARRAGGGSAIHRDFVRARPLRFREYARCGPYELYALIRPPEAR